MTHSSQPTCDLLLRSGTVVDGTGKPAFQADVAVKAGKIAAVGNLAGAQAERVLDCAGRCVSPGWIDFHGHADWSVFDHPQGLNLLIQGCTLTVAGNCGMAVAPVQGRATALLRAGDVPEGTTAQAMARRRPSLEWSFAGLLDEVERSGLGVNYVQLAGHSAIRRCVMGEDARPAGPDEVQQMAALLDRCLEEGAFGFSTGLVFPPGCWCETAEVVALCRVVARHGGLYATHQRGERETNIEATQEAIAIAEQSGARANISHMQSKYPVFGGGRRKIEMLQAARERGVDLSNDYEIYRGHPATLAGFLQLRRFTPEGLVRQLSTAEGRAELKRSMLETDPLHPLGRSGPGGVAYRRAWHRVVIFDCPHDRSLEGRTVAAVAAERGTDPEECLFELTLREEGRGPLMVNDYIEDEHFLIVPWAHTIVPSIDTGLYDPATRTPLDYRFELETRFPSKLGMAPRVLGQFVREERLFSLEEGVRRMTSLPASRLGLTDRGVLRPGAWADLVVFDREAVAMRSPHPDPSVPASCWPAGIDYVIVNGQVAMEGHRFTGARAGRVLRG